MSRPDLKLSLFLVNIQCFAPPPRPLYIAAKRRKIRKSFGQVRVRCSKLSALPAEALAKAGSMFDVHLYSHYSSPHCLVDVGSSAFSTIKEISISPHSEPIPSSPGGK